MEDAVQNQGKSTIIKAKITELATVAATPDSCSPVTELKQATNGLAELLAAAPALGLSASRLPVITIGAAYHADSRFTFESR